MRYLERDGKTELTQAQFEAIFGPAVIVTRPQGKVDYVVDALQDSGEGHGAVAEVLIMQKPPPAGVFARLGYPGGADTIREWKVETQFPWPFANAVVVHQYFPDRGEGGPYSFDLDGAPAERVSGIGLVAGTNHRHVRVWYKVFEGEEGGSGGSVTVPEGLLDRLKRMQVGLAEIEEKLKTMQAELDAVLADLAGR
jgi:hypothetical protein